MIGRQTSRAMRNGRSSTTQNQESARDTRPVHQGDIEQIIKLVCAKDGNGYAMPEFNDPML